MNSIRAASSEFGARSDQRCMALGSRDSQGLMGNVYSAQTEVIFRPEHLLQQQSKTSSPDERHYPSQAGLGEREGARARERRKMEHVIDVLHHRERRLRHKTEEEEEKRIQNC